MSRVEALARFFVITGLVIGLATVGLVLLRRGENVPSGPSGAPSLDELDPVLDEASVLFDRQRDDLGTGEQEGRTVVLSVPDALNEAQAGTLVLSSLRDSGWLVSSRGGAIRRDGTVCLAVSTPPSWLADRANAELRDEVQNELAEARTVTVVVDLFFCSDAQRE